MIVTWVGSALAAPEAGSRAHWCDIAAERLRGRMWLPDVSRPFTVQFAHHAGPGGRLRDGGCVGGSSGAVLLFACRRNIQHDPSREDIPNPVPKRAAKALDGVTDFAASRPTLYPSRACLINLPHSPEHPVRLGSYHSRVSSFQLENGRIPYSDFLR
jgi:hypothetical protein